MLPGLAGQSASAGSSHRAGLVRAREEGGLKLQKLQQLVNMEGPTRPQKGISVARSPNTQTLPHSQQDTPPPPAWGVLPAPPPGPVVTPLEETGAYVFGT